MTSEESIKKTGLLKAREEFMNILRNINDLETKQSFLSWIKWNWMDDFKQDDQLDDVLKAIADDIKKVLPADAVLPTENITSPAVGENADCDPRHTLHVDAFLYDDQEVDEMSEDGRLDRHYCLQCGSHKTKPLTFISHSASRDRLRYIFTSLLPPLDSRDTIILDVGSRLGAVLYAARIYTKADKILGIEINEDFCNLQKEMINKYGFQDRISVVHGDVVEAADMIHSADVLVLNNVFEFFASAEQQVSAWQTIHSSARPGALLVTIPALETSLAHLKTGINISSWVKRIPPFDPEAPGVVDPAEHAAAVSLYEVL